MANFGPEQNPGLWGLISAGAAMMDPRGTYGSFGAGLNRGVTAGLNTYGPWKQWQVQQQAAQQKQMQEAAARQQLAQFMATTQPQQGNMPTPQQFAPLASAGYGPTEISAIQKLYGGNGVDANFGLQPVYAMGPDGTLQAYQLNKGGGASQVKFPEGVAPVRPQTTIGLGGGVATYDPYRNQMTGYYPKSLPPEQTPQVKAQQAAATSAGTAEAAAANELADRMATMPRLEQVVNELSDLGQKATYTKAGKAYDVMRREAGLSPRDAAIARKEYISKVDNEILPLLRQTFGAQFTEKEGQALKATLGDPNASPAEKDAVLRSFIQTKQAQIETLKRRTGVVDRTGAPPVEDPLGIRK